ncbi:MAG: LLM class flavin-dependent oxidoreductase [Candidatus Hodarchaeales archaeon]|jgi:5,10-methylenetetrahydromethanopterin reductase
MILDSASQKSSITIAIQTDKSVFKYMQIGKLVEDLGFDGVTVYNDLLYQPAWIPLSQLARATSKIQIGVASVNPFTNHPINIAGNIANIDALSSGRAYLGLSKGAWLDYLSLNPKYPIRALKDAFACIKHLLSQNKDHFESDFFPLKGGTSLRWKLHRSNIPLLLGSWGPQTIKACKNYISELKLGGTANPAVVPWIRDILKSSDIDIVLGSVTVVDEDGDKARNLARKEVALYLPVIGKLDPTLSIPSDLLSSIAKATSKYNFKEASEYVDDKLLTKFTFSGTSQEIINQTIAIFESGANRVEFGTPHGLDQTKGIELLGKEVLPVIREKIKAKNHE